MMRKKYRSRVSSGGISKEKYIFNEQEEEKKTSLCVRNRRVPVSVQARLCVCAQFHFVCTQNGRMFLEQPAMSQPVVLSEYCKKDCIHTHGA
jgi:hypothetical protein